MNKILGFLEDHVEKIVLAVVVLLCLWPLTTRVILSPNTVTFDGKDLSPGAIDDYVYDLARDLELVLAESPKAPNSYEPIVGSYLSMLDSSVGDIDSTIMVPIPESNPDGGVVAKEYKLPQDLGQVSDVAVNCIRAVAYIPFQEVTTDRPYDDRGSEPNDIDLVTVEGHFDIASLRASFEASFSGPAVKPEWRDPELGSPVFSAVCLQRQEAGGDGSWSAWEDVPRIRTDPRRELFTIIEDAGSLPPGGLTVRILQYRAADVQRDLLQPGAYRIASANEEWFPPLLYPEYVKIRTAEAQEERRRIREEEKEKEKEKESSGDSESGRRRSSTSGGGRRGSDASQLSGRAGSRDSRGRVSSGRTGQLDGGRRSRSARSGETKEDTSEEEDARREAEKPTVDDVFAKLDALFIDTETGLSEHGELVFWAHDDSVMPGKTYRYRMRLGIFNPVAGKNQLGGADAQKNNEVILWSDFSTPSAPIEIARRLYFFAEGIQEAAKEVTVKVSKYVLGSWHSEDFKVKSGEVIGDIVESKPVVSGGGPLDDPDLASATASEPLSPEVIDYSTGAVLVDVVAVNDWGGGNTMRSQQYFDMLYSYDGTDIQRMSIGDRYWPADLQAARSEIRNSQREPTQPLRGWNETRGPMQGLPSPGRPIRAGGFPR
ncbi:MAG: hypothetical protein JW720_15380 [Sedimentisphaerales bacterium]|nr:hypothetical protein [Sedimentisphaerales bacterium]